MMKWRQPLMSFGRHMSTLQRKAANKKALLVKPIQNSGRRNMGHGPDISVFEAFMYVGVGGGGIALWGVYKTTQMRDRIEAYEAGQIVPLKELTDEEFFKYKKEFIERFSEDEEEEESSEGSSEEEETSQESEEEPPQFHESSQQVAKSNKDTVIFIDAPK